MHAIGIGAEAIFSNWLGRFARAFEAADADAIASFFGEDSFWKDMLSFSWDFPTYEGREAIATALRSHVPEFEPALVRIAEGRTAARLVRRSGLQLIEGFFDFETKWGTGSAFVRLKHDPETPDDPKIWILLTTLQQLAGHEEQIGVHRPTGEEYSKNQTRNNWLDDRRARAAYADRDPEVVIIGAGHSGLALAARLKAMGVDALVLEKTGRIGDVWRRRYHSLTLHNQVFANHLPYMPFPETWPTWLPKDKLAGWLESYAEALELNVWLDTTVDGAEFDPVAKEWTVTIRRDGGEPVALRCKQLVAALGVSGSIPNVPQIEGLDTFDGVVQHSSQFRSGNEFAGKRVLVVGTGNSGHDIAQDLHICGADVSLLQRGPSCVVSLEPTATMIYSIYSQGLPLEDVDLQTAAVPYPVLSQTYKAMTTKSRSMDNVLIDSLNGVGFQTFYGDDDTGFHMMYLRGEGGYYIDVGCSQLISSGAIKVIDFRDFAGFSQTGLKIRDRPEIPFDAVILATGFKNMQENISRLLGRKTGDRIGKIWGFDHHNMMRNMWTQTAQEAFWVMGGGLIDARLFSRFLAIQLAAALDGNLPIRAQADAPQATA